MHTRGGTFDHRVLSVISGQGCSIEVFIRVPSTIDEVLHLLAGHGALGFPSAGDGWVLAAHHAPLHTCLMDDERIIAEPRHQQSLRRP